MSPRAKRSHAAAPRARRTHAERTAETRGRILAAGNARLHAQALRILSKAG